MIVFFEIFYFIEHSPFGPELSIRNNTEYQAQVGDRVELPCGIASISKRSRISWWKNDIEIDHLSTKIYNNSLLLQLSNTSSNDSGNYICRVDDETNGRMVSSMFLKVNRMLNKSIFSSRIIY